MTRLFVFGMMLNLAGLPAQAKSPPFTCTPAEAIDNDGEGSCEDNGRFTQAGQECLKLLENAIQARAKTAEAQLAASNLAKTVTAGNAQTNNFSGASADYAISQQALAELIAAARQARRSVEGQLSHIYYPEDFDAPPEVIGDPGDFLDGNPCYADNEKALKGILKTIDQHIADLEKARTLSARKGRASDAREQKMLGSSNPLLHGGVGQGAGKAKGAGPSRDSDVSGTKENEQRRAKEKSK